MLIGGGSKYTNWKLLDLVPLRLLVRDDFERAPAELTFAATYLISENSDQSLSSNIAKGDLVVDSSLLGQLASSWPQVQVNNR